MANQAARARQIQRLCAPMLTTAAASGLPHAAVTRSSRGRLAGLVYASDARAGDLVDLQETLGEGPTISAATDGVPFLAEDLTTYSDGPAWLMFGREATVLGVRAVFAFPLTIGAVRLGVLTLHGGGPAHVGPAALAEMLRVLDTLSVALLAPETTVDDLGVWTDLMTPGHATVNQAAGMVSVQAGCSLQDALWRLQAHALGRGISLARAANDVVMRRVRFSSTGDAISPATDDRWTGTGDDGHDDKGDSHG